MKYWFLLIAIMFPVLHAPAYISYTIFMFAYAWFAMHRVHKHQNTWATAIMSLILFGILFISIPKGHHIAGLVQLAIMVGTILALSYSYAGLRVVRTIKE